MLASSAREMPVTVTSGVSGSSGAHAANETAAANVAIAKTPAAIFLKYFIVFPPTEFYIRPSDRGGIVKQKGHSIKENVLICIFFVVSVNRGACLSLRTPPARGTRRWRERCRLPPYTKTRRRTFPPHSGCSSTRSRGMPYRACLWRAARRSRFPPSFYDKSMRNFFPLIPKDDNF